MFQVKYMCSLTPTMYLYIMYTGKYIYDYVMVYPLFYFS